MWITMVTKNIAAIVVRFYSTNLVKPLTFEIAKAIVTAFSIAKTVKHAAPHAIVILLVWHV